MITPSPPRPASINEFKTYIYKEFDERPFYVDTYLPFYMIIGTKDELFDQEHIYISLESF